MDTISEYTKMSNTSKIESKFPFSVVLDPEKEDRSDRYLDEHDEIYIHVHTRNKPNLKKVERFFQRWKKYPEVWNFYYGALVKNSRKDEAEKLLQKTLETFPDYFFGKNNYVKTLIFNDKLNEAVEYLGSDTPEIQRWFPAQTEIWIEHVLQYYALFVQLEIKKKDYEKAAEYIRFVVEQFSIYEQNNEEVSECFHSVFNEFNLEIAAYNLFKLSERDKDFVIREPEYTEPEPPAGYAEKAFVHPEIEALFKLQMIDKEDIDAILSLPRESALADLEQILYRTMFEYTDEDLDRNEYYAVPHALWFLYVLKGVESSELGNLLLQMDTEFIEYWFGDFWIEESWFYFYMLLDQGRTEILETLYMPNKSSYARSSLYEAMEQLAYHHPERREEVIGWHDDLLQHYIDNMDNDDILDTTGTGFLVTNALNMNAVSLMPKLRILFENHCIDEMIAGDLAEVESEMMKINPTDKYKKQLPTIYELADKEKNQFVEWEKELSLYAEKEKKQSQNFSFPPQPSEEKYPKTGRNDPCPCGSGKKYKKCCGG